MGLEVQIAGAATLHEVAARIRAEGNKPLARQMASALAKAVDPVKVSIRAEASKAMPSGYRSLLTGSLRHRMSRRASGQQARVLLATYADGKQERRDIRALNNGLLRHPLFGRKKVWYVTAVRPGFHDRGTEDAMDVVQDAMIQVVDDFAARLIT